MQWPRHGDMRDLEPEGRGRDDATAWQHPPGVGYTRCHLRNPGGALCGPYLELQGTKRELLPRQRPHLPQVCVR